MLISRCHCSCRKARNSGQIPASRATSEGETVIDFCQGVTLPEPRAENDATAMLGSQGIPRSCRTAARSVRPCSNHSLQGSHSATKRCLEDVVDKHVERARVPESSEPVAFGIQEQSMSYTIPGGHRQSMEWSPSLSWIVCRCGTRACKPKVQVNKSNRNSI